MKIILFGKQGQLGWELHRELAPRGEVRAVDREDLDLRDAAALERFLKDERPHLIVNASAYTAVDRAEQEPELAFQVNAQAPGIMAAIACKLNAGLIHFSTDYVFDGELGRPYLESDTPQPLNVYGASKLAGERAIRQAGGAHLTFRTAWVYSLRADSFVTKILKLARRERELRVVTDQISSPTWVRALANVVSQLLDRPKGDLTDFIRQYSGLYHVAGRGHASRFEWAQAILAAVPNRDDYLVQAIRPALTDEFPAPARRPLFSALECARFETTFGLRLPEWEKSLRSALNDRIEMQCN